ncbi:MAG: hypothetical protein IJM57_07810 [Lachnospiraceae bacterium]|nr:hypothetical protein [Lachnospiraceae bacterium]
MLAISLHNELQYGACKLAHTQPRQSRHHRAGDEDPGAGPAVVRRLPQKGKLKYGYMTKDVKNLVDEVVNRLEKHPKVAELYELWYQQKCAIIATYTSSFPPKEPLSENEVFRPIKNAVLEAAVGMDLPEKMEGQGGVGALSDQNRHHGPESSGVFIGHEKDYNEANRKGGGFSGYQELEETLARIEREHAASAEMMLPAYSNTDANDVSFRSIESFLYRVSKVFEEKRPIGDRGQVTNRKMYVREAERKGSWGCNEMLHCFAILIL